MFIELTKEETIRGIEYDAGSIVEVGGELGERLVLNGHKNSTLNAFKAWKKSNEKKNEPPKDNKGGK